MSASERPGARRVEAVERAIAVLDALADSLERTLGVAQAPAFLAEIEDRADGLRGVGRTLFERWLSTLSA